MPFTPTHIAAAIPIAWLCRWRISFSALAIGTMIPDAPLFLPSYLPYEWMHSTGGLFTHCLPLGLLAYYLFHLLIKQPMVDLFPDAIRSRLLSTADSPLHFGLANLGVACLLILFGAWTHICWDSFTHIGRWGTDTFPWLRTVAIKNEYRNIRWYAIFQHGSSLVLLPPMTLGFFLWLRTQTAQPLPHRVRLSPWTTWPAIGLILIGSISHYFALLRNHKDYLWIDALRYTVKDTGAVLLIVVLAYCVTMQLIWLKTAAHQQAEPTSD